MITEFTATVTPTAGRLIEIAVGDHITQAHDLDEVAPMTESLIQITNPDIGDYTVTYVWPPIYLDPHLAADYAGVELDTLRIWVHRGHINRYKQGYEKGEIDAWLNRRKDNKIRH